MGKMTSFFNILRLTKRKFKVVTFSRFIQLIYSIFRILSSKISLLYSLNLSFALGVFLFLFYFLVLVNIKPFNSTYIKNIIIKDVSSSIDYDFKISDLFLSFTYDGNIKVDISDLKIIDEKNNHFNDLVFDKASMEIPLFRIMIFNFTPTNLVIDNAKIEVDALPISSDSYALNRGIFKSSASLVQFFRSIELSNVDLVVKNPNKSDINVNIAQSNFTIDVNGDIDIANESDIFIKGKKSNLSSRCKLKKNYNGNCRFFVSDLNLGVFSNLFLEETALDYISSNSDIGLIFSFDEKVSFKLQVQSSNIILKSGILFNNDIYLADSYINADLLLTEGNLAINSVLKSFISKNSDYSTNNSSKVSFKLQSKNIRKHNNIKIELTDVKHSNLNFFWPKKFYHLPIRTWINNNIKSGLVPSSSISFDMVKRDNILKVENLKSKIKINDAKFKYSKSYPEIYNSNLDIYFVDKKMDIYIKDGNVLNSKIKDLKLSISDISNPLLEISGLFSGKSSDLFSHIGYKNKDFVGYSDEFFGNSLSDANFAVQLPIKNNNNLKLDDVYCLFDVKTYNFYNDYLSGSFDLNIKKDYGDSSFIATVDLMDSFTLKDNIFAIKKNHNDQMLIDFSLSLTPSMIKISDFMVNNGKSNILSIKTLDVDKNESKLSFLDLKKFGSNFINVTIDNTGSKSIVKIDSNRFSVSGKASKGFDLSKIVDLDNIDLDLNINRVYSDDKFTSNFMLRASCLDSYCETINGYSYKGPDKIFQINNINSSSYEMNIYDVGYFLDIFGFSKSVKYGALSIDIDYNSANDNKPSFYKIFLNLNSSITVYDNETLKTMESDNLFYKVKDNIFSNNKTSFSRVIGSLYFYPQSRILNVKKFVANNIKIGITTKGEYNFSNGKFDFAGLIIPAYFINNLFGIGNIPILGDVINKVIIGDENSGIFGLRYSYSRNRFGALANFKTFPMSSILPSSIQMMLID